MKSSTVKCYAANGTPITVYGEVLLKIDLGLRRECLWNFLSADVTCGIIGADFISHYGLLVDLKRKRLVDNLTSVASIGKLVSSEALSVKTFDTSCEYTSLLKEFGNITRLAQLGSTAMSEVVHHIETHGPPLSARPRRLSPDKLAAAKAEFDSLIKLGICRPSSSSWASPLHMVKKADGTWRPCGDFRALNTVTIPDRYPIPYLQDFTSNLRGKTIFSKIDLQKAFHQVPVNPEDVPKTAIITPFGLFEFLYMPFGLRNAAQTLQRLIHEVLRGLDFVFPYMDDICVASSSLDEHLLHLRRLFERLQKHNLRINATKSVFGKTEIIFLGHTVSAVGIRPLRHRVQAIIDLEKPTTVN